MSPEYAIKTHSTVATSDLVTLRAAADFVFTLESSV
jgi:hypothetical protein